MTTPADLQSAIAAYLSRTPGRPVSFAELADALGAPRGTVAPVLARIVNGEARPYPIIRSGRGQYMWIHDVTDHHAHVVVLTEMIGYMTGASSGRAAQYAEHILRLAAVEGAQ